MHIPFPTLGGLQFWSDVHYRAGWRIQRNVLTGHHRLLDPRNLRRAYGRLETCRTRLAAVTDESADDLVLVLHGLGRTAHSMYPVVAHLREAGLETAALNYPSLYWSVEEHARNLADLLADIPGGRRISFVTHSLGGLVVRQLTAHPEWQEQHAFHRVVMLAPPSTRAELADRLAAVSPRILNQVASDLVEGRPEAFPRLPCEFAVIAGSRKGGGWNPLLTGADDGVVTVAETRLNDDHPFLEVHSTHTWIMRQPDVLQAVEQFLTTGTLPDQGRANASMPSDL